MWMDIGSNVRAIHTLCPLLFLGFKVFKAREAWELSTLKLRYERVTSTYEMYTLEDLGFKVVIACRMEISLYIRISICCFFEGKKISNT